MITLKKVSRFTLIASSMALLFGAANAQTATEASQAVQAQPSQPAQNTTPASQMGQETAGGSSASASSMQNRPADATAPQMTGDTSGAGKTQAAQGAQSAQGAQAAQGATPSVIYMMVPLDAVTANDAMKRGCWVKLYDDQNYRGESLTLVGPTKVEDMSGPFGLNWDDRVRSLETGSNATLTVFDDDEFEDRVAQFKPGQRVAEVNKRLGFFDEFGSIQLDCVR